MVPFLNSLTGEGKEYRVKHPGSLFLAVLLVAGLHGQAWGQGRLPSPEEMLQSYQKWVSQFPVRKAIVSFNFGMNCTGVVLAPKVILTASHCTAGFKTGGRVWTTAPMESTANCRQASVAKKFHFPPGAKFTNSFGVTAADIDLSVIELAESLCGATAEPIPVCESMMNQARSFAIGNGRAGTRRTPIALRLEPMTLAEIIQYTRAPRNYSARISKEIEEDQSHRFLGTSAQGDRVTCYGDSGGLVYSQTRDRRCAIGVISGAIDAGQGSESCPVNSVMSFENLLVPATSQWLRQLITEVR